MKELEMQVKNLNMVILKERSKKEMYERLASERKEEIEKLKAKIRKLEENK